MSGGQPLSAPAGDQPDRGSRGGRAQRTDRGERRRAAIIATAVALPVVVVVALFLGGSGSSPSDPSSPAVAGPVSVAAPARTDDATVSKCASVISAMPLRLDGQDVRRTVSNPPSPSIVAWGNPAIVLTCGVARPADLKRGSSTVFVTAGPADGPFYDVVKDGDANVWTTVDRAVYISIRVPATYNSGPLPTLSTAIAKVLPAVCIAGQAPTGTTDQSKLCVRRK